ncbi:MAG TPA: DMT family transporter [Chloroflexaceae bacterium]|nr:DMT family transporter [Chloroflexaceae bacterium]
MSDERRPPAPGAGPVATAAAWMAGALLSFMAMAVGGRELAGELSTFQILFFRSLVGLAVIGLLLWRAGWRLARTARLGLHLVRNLAHFGGQFGWFLGLGYIPLAEVFAIEFTTPIWTAIWAALLLRERLTGPRLAAIALGVAGLLLILRPGLQSVHPAALAVLAGAVGYALSHTLTRRLALADAPLTILFFMTVIQLPLGLIPSLPSWRWPAAELWPWLVVVGLTALSAHYCMARALALADATVVVPLDFLRLPLIAVVGALFYGEPLAPLVLAGAALMLLGNWVNLRAEGRRRAHPRPSAEAPALE